MKTILFLVGFILLANFVQGQKKFVVEGIVSAYFNSERHANENGDQKAYYELRAGYRLNKYFEFNAFAGFQSRSFIYYAKFDSPWQLVPLYMDRKYVPIGVNGRINLSDFFYEKLHVWKKQNRWDIYNQIGIAILTGKDKRDSRDSSFANKGATVPYYLIPYEEEYNKVYVTYLAGIRYNFNRSLGIFVEVGDGALMNLQIGISAGF